MRASQLLYTCVVLSRCPCCAEGRLFEGFLRIRERCPSCGLHYDQWVGEWITPTYIATTIGMLVAFGLIIAMIGTGLGMDAAIPAELIVCVASGLVAVAALRPSKAFWLAFLYLIGGVEVSAQTRAHLRWWAVREGREASRDLAEQAERRARSGRGLQPPGHEQVDGEAEHEESTG